MKIKLENIGALKKANVKIDGLTVIAGENDTGKSTLGKALYYGLRVIKIIHSLPNTEKFSFEHATAAQKCGEIFNVNIMKGLNVDFLVANKIDIDIDSITIPTIIADGSKNAVSYNDIKPKLKNIKKVPDVLFIETPISLNFFDFFNDINTLEKRVNSYGENISIDRPHLLFDLDYHLKIKQKDTDICFVHEEIKNIIDGEFVVDDMGKLVFLKNNKKIDIVNTATGIKAFGILQILSKNNRLNKNMILVLDEPEVHLHPKWQLDMARIIVKLVSSGVKIVVNSHSPYMIEALHRYTDNKKLRDKSNFYLAKDGAIKDENNISEIFELLSQPFDEFDKMDSDILNAK
ncbi:MAG: hypothetical protein DRG11_03410 [Epsilonproteobacteria bacterium]|nr:MAG: hypothetical protein DRG11_03410 [Campylobacterota bacterium]